MKLVDCGCRPGGYWFDTGLLSPRISQEPCPHCSRPKIGVKSLARCINLCGPNCCSLPPPSDLGVVASLGAQTPSSDKSSTPAKKETVAKPMTEKQQKKQEEKLRKELETPYKKWLNEDVVYIITDEERKAFKTLQTDEERAAVHRAVLAAPRSHARHRRKRVPRRALPPHRLRQRAFRVRHSRLEDRPRHDLHQVRPAGRERSASLGRHL